MHIKQEKTTFTYKDDRKRKNTSDDLNFLSLVLYFFPIFYSIGFSEIWKFPLYIDKNEDSV